MITTCPKCKEMHETTTEMAYSPEESERMCTACYRAYRDIASIDTPSMDRSLPNMANDWARAQIIAGGNGPSAEVVALLIEAANNLIAALRVELGAAQQETKTTNDLLEKFYDPFRVDHWPFRYKWRTVDADGQIVYHKEMPTLLVGMWFSDDIMDSPGSMQMFCADYRNSLRARPTETAQ